MYRAVSAHKETHLTGSEMVRDIVIGMSDGLTVPFALASGFSGTVASGHVVLIAGIAEMAAGSSPPQMLTRCSVASTPS